MPQPIPLGDSYTAQVPPFYIKNHSPTPILKSVILHCTPQPTERANHHWPLNIAWWHIAYRRAAHQKPENSRFPASAEKPYYP